MTGLADNEMARQIQAQQFLAGLGMAGAGLSNAGSNILQLWPELNQMTGALAGVDIAKGNAGAQAIRNSWGGLANAFAGMGAGMSRQNLAPVPQSVSQAGGQSTFNESNWNGQWGSLLDY